MEPFGRVDMVSGESAVIGRSREEHQVFTSVVSTCTTFFAGRLHTRDANFNSYPVT